MGPHLGVLRYIPALDVERAAAAAAAAQRSCPKKPKAAINRRTPKEKSTRPSPCAQYEVERWAGRGKSPMKSVLTYVRRTALRRDGPGVDDGELLEQFLARRDDAAFAALVRRHGPMVLSVARRVLGHVQDAEDVFQATFLVLVKKAATLQRRELLANWLYGVAYRTALEARSSKARRRAREMQRTVMPEPAVNTVEHAGVAGEVPDIIDQE